MKSGLVWRTSEVKTVPEEIPDDDHELVIERVCAIDVAKASGKVCVRDCRTGVCRVGGAARYGMWRRPRGR
jgi:hypothetical protein